MVSHYGYISGNSSNKNYPLRQIKNKKELLIQLFNELKGKRSVDNSYFNDKTSLYGRIVKFTHDNTMLIVAVVTIIIKSLKY